MKTFNENKLTNQNILQCCLTKAWTERREWQTIKTQFLTYIESIQQRWGNDFLPLDFPSDLPVPYGQLRAWVEEKPKENVFLVFAGKK